MTDTINLDQDQTRTYQTRATADPSKREISGIGVPLEDEIEVYPGFREVFDQECVFDNIDRAKLKTHHRELIGVIASHERETGKLSITGRASQTRTADEALELARDGALDSFSIGFRPIEYTITQHDDGSETVRHTRVRTNEFSLTDNPAYEHADVTDVREATTVQPLSRKETTMTDTDTLTREDLDATRDELGEQIRTVQAALADLVTLGEQTRTDTRSAGEVLQAIAAGDTDMIREYNELMERAYTGGTSADSPIKDGWVGDLTRIFDASAGTLSEFFSTGVLPDTGMNIEFAELLLNTMQVTEQEDEGDDLAKGKVTLTTRTAPVKTYGGYTELSIQQIKRSTLPILNRSLEALALAAGARKKAVMRAAYLALVTARTALPSDAGVLKLGATKPNAEAGHWTDLVVDASTRFDQLDLSLDGMIVSPAIFKHLNGLVIEGNRVFNVSKDRNTIGELNLPGLTGDLAGITVVADAGRAGDAAEFANARALRQYDSAVTQLQDENIINLSKAFSVYRFGAVAAEIPAAVVPVKFAA